MAVTASAEVSVGEEAAGEWLEVRVAISGGGPGLRLRIGRWGDWDPADSSHLLSADVDGQRVSPDSTGEIGLPEVSPRRPERHARLRYRIRPEGADPAMPLLPRRSGPGLIWFVENVVPRLVAADGRALHVRRLRISAPAGMRVEAGSLLDRADCGSGGCSLRAGNGVVAIVPRSSAAHVDPLGRVRVVDVSGSTVARQVALVAGAVERHRPLFVPGPGGPRLLILERSGTPGVSSGTATPHALLVSLSPAETLPEPQRQLIAHELTHASVPVPDDDTTTPLWFIEGVVEYLAARTRVLAGDADLERFVALLRGHEARARRTLRAGARFGERDGVARRGGLEEALAYSAGALLAFRIDAGLRACGGSLDAALHEAFGLPGAEEPARAFVRGVHARGLRAPTDSALVDGTLPRLRDGLLHAGFTVSRSPTSLTYLGFGFPEGASLHRQETRVVERVAHDGPAARAGLQVGDTVLSVTAPPRDDPPWVDDTVATAYSAGLDEVASGSREVTLLVRRGGAIRAVTIVPVLIRGGYRERAEASSLPSVFRSAASGDGRCRQGETPERKVRSSR